MSFMFPTAIIGSTVKSDAQVVFYEVGQAIFAFVIMGCYVSVYYCSLAEESPAINTAGFCVLAETRDCCRITAIAIHNQTLFAAVSTFASTAAAESTKGEHGLVGIDQLARTPLLFAGSIAQFVKRHCEDPQTAAIAFLSPLPAKLTQSIYEPVKLLRILPLGAADAVDHSSCASPGERVPTTMIAAITESGCLYHSCSEALELKPIDLRGPCNTIMECKQSESISCLFIGGLGYAASIDPFEGKVLHYIDLGQMSRPGDDAPTNIISIIRYGRYVYIFSDDNRILQVKIGDWKALRTLNKPLQLFSMVGVFQSNELFYCYGTNGVVRSITCDTLKLYSKMVISSFKYLHHYSASSIVKMFVSKHGICSVLDDSTIAIYRQGDSSEHPLHAGANPRSMLRSRMGGSNADRSNPASIPKPNTFALNNVFYGHTPFCDHVFLGESTLYSYSQPPGNSCCVAIRRKEYGQAKMFNSLPNYINFISVGDFIIGFCTRAEVLRLNLTHKLDPAATVCLLIYDVHRNRFILTYPFKKFTKVSLMTANLTPDNKLQVYFATDDYVFYFRNLDVIQAVYHNLVPLCARFPQLKKDPDSFSMLFTPQVPNCCYFMTKTGIIYQLTFDTETSKKSTHTVFQSPQNVIDVFGVHISPNGRYLLVGITSMVPPDGAGGAADDSSLRSEVFIINIDRENTRILLKQTILDKASLSEIPEGPAALAVGYLAGNGKQPDSAEDSQSTRFSGMVSQQGDFSDMMYAILFKYRRLISVYSVIFNKRIAVLSSLQLDPTLRDHQLYFDNAGSLVVYVANDKSIIRYTPLTRETVYSLLHIQSPGGASLLSHTGTRGSSKDDNSLGDLTFGEGTYFEDNEVVTSWARPASTELTIKLGMTCTGINPVRHGHKDNVQEVMDNSCRERDRPVANSYSSKYEVTPTLDMDSARSEQKSSNSVSPTAVVKGEKEARAKEALTYTSLSDDSDLSNEVIEAYEHNLQTLSANQGPRLTEMALDSVFENVDILDEESVIKRLDSSQTREVLSESIILTMKDILLSSNSSPVSSKDNSAHATPKVLPPAPATEPHAPPKLKPVVSPDALAHRKVEIVRPVITFSENLSKVAAAALPGPKYETVASVQHIPQGQKSMQPESMPTSPATNPDARAVAAIPDAVELNHADVDSGTRHAGTIFSPSGHDNHNNTIKLPASASSGHSSSKASPAKPSVDLNLSLKKSSSLLQSIAAARMNIHTALMELESLQMQCSQDEYATILASAAPQLQEEAKHLSQVQSKVSTLAALHSSSNSCWQTNSRPESAGGDPAADVLIGPKSNILAQYSSSDGYIPTSQFEDILTQFGHHLISSLKSFIARPAVGGPGALQDQPQPLSGAELANALQLPPISQSDS